MNNKRPGPSVIDTITVGVTPTKILSQATTRSSVRFSVMSADVYIAPDAQVALGAGLRVVDGDHSEEVCSCHAGDWVERELWAIADGAPATLHIISGFNSWHEA